MSDIYRYTVETEDSGESAPYDTYQEAEEVARREGGKVIEYEYEFSDSHMVADFTGSA